METTRLTVGARVSDEENEWVVNDVLNYSFAAGVVIPRDFRDINVDSGPFSVNASSPFAEPTVDRKFGDTFEPFVWRIAVDHDLSEDILIYANVATGYSSGGMNSIQDPHTGRFTFSEQESIAYEVGFKSTLLDGAMTVNIAAYYNDYKDYIAEPAGVLASGSVIVFNRVGGDADAKGIDLEVDWIPAENWFTSLRFSWLDAEYGDFVTGLGGTLTTAGGLEETYVAKETPLTPAGSLQPQIRLDGRQISYSPDFTLGLMASYNYDIGDGWGTLTPLVMFYYSDDYSTSDQGYLHGLQDNYTQTDLFLAWRSKKDSNGGNYQMTAFVKNLEDNAIITRANIFGATLATRQHGPPRTFGLSLNYVY